MAKSKEPEILGECAYCPNPGTTKDHIPPQTIYAKGTQNKPWVPACRSCNGVRVKTMSICSCLAMLWGADGSKDARRGRGAILQSAPAGRGEKGCRWTCWPRCRR